MNIELLEQVASSFDDGFFLVALAILLMEAIRRLASGSLRRQECLDATVNVSTQLPFLFVEVFAISSIYVAYSLISSSFINWHIPTTALTALVAVLAADFVYYWEHRIAHEVRLFWTQHAVHHSSRFMNISVGLRFGPFEGLLSALMHLPLIFIGFPPELVFFGIVMVQAYQSWIHTELIGSLGVLDSWLNTPANHRVHHGCDEKYIDKNYGGIFIVWDRIFGTYQHEEETPNYGLANDFSSVNPLKVWTSELPRFFADIKAARSAGELWRVIFGRPGNAMSSGDELSVKSRPAMMPADSQPAKHVP